MQNARPDAANSPASDTLAPTFGPDHPASWISADARKTHLAWLLELSATPSAAGKEHRVEAWIERWVKARNDLTLSRDAVGNLTVALADEPTPPSDAPPHDLAPLYITAHMDHPAFVIEQAHGEGRFEASFRGGVMDDYFTNAPVAIHSSTGTIVRARVTAKVQTSIGPFKHWILEALPDQPWRDIAVGDVAVWDVGPAEIVGDIVHTLACDDLAAASAAIAAFDVIRELDAAARAEGRRAVSRPVRLLFTRAEEVGFIGAIAAIREKTVPADARVILLENSRSFPDSPIGGGPVVRVGDRISIFSPRLTDAVGKRAEELAGGPAVPLSTQKATTRAWKWQRKLMAGGACEASVFCAAGYEAMCVCLALGNYHNMGELTAVQAGEYKGTPPIQREFISKTDFEGLVDLLVACAIKLPQGGFGPERFDKLWSDAGSVLSS